MKIPAAVRTYALAYKINVSRDHHGVYTIKKHGFPGTWFAQSAGGAIAKMRMIVRAYGLKAPPGKLNPTPTSKAIRRQLKKRAKPPKKRNPRVDWYIHIQKHGRGPVMLFNGVSFSSPENRAPQPFASATNAMQKARWLLAKHHRHLSAYKIWVSDQYYGAPTQAGRVNPRRRKNPEKLDEAARKLEDFTGRQATHVERAPARSDEKTGLVIGELKAVEYLAAREGIEGGRMVRWHHKFRKGSRPLLAATTDGKQLHVVGGQYEFTEAGIEDR